MPTATDEEVEVAARVAQGDEEAKRIKLSYKQIHKTRGVKCRVPQFKIGFETVRQILPTWIERELKNEKNK